MCKQCMMKKQGFEPVQYYKSTPWCESESCKKPEPWCQPVPSCHHERCDVIVICEEPVYCCEEVYRYHIVEHHVPVVVKKVVNDVYKHEYIVETEEKIEHHREDIGKKDHVNWCDVVQHQGENKQDWC